MSLNFFEFREKMLSGGNAPAPAPAPVTPSLARTKPKPLTVSQLTRLIEGTLRDAFPYTILVRGEISNANPHRVSGHLYFTLKDAEACLDCVMFKSDAVGLKFQPNDGLEVLASGRIGVYVSRGRYQLYVTRLEPVGQGALELAFRQLQAKLEAEGLFARERKRPLPSFPARIALVTSKQTAALQDMLKVLRRFPWLKLTLCHVPVQGDGSAERMAAAITKLNQQQSHVPDVIILARGGGSLEDLWEFNEEILARAIAASRIPIVTGIGHEVDTSIADLVADYHAHTPTEAAQVVTAHWRNAHDLIESSAGRLARALTNQLQDARHRLIAIERHEAFRRPLDRINGLRQVLDDRERSMQLALARRLGEHHRRVLDLEHRLETLGPVERVRRLHQRLNMLDQRLCSAGATRLRKANAHLERLTAGLRERHPRHLVRLLETRLDGLARQLHCEIDAAIKRRVVTLDLLGRHLQAIGPEQVLARGYTITLTKKGRKVIRSAKDVAPNDHLITRFADGEVESTADDPRQPGLFQ